LTSSNRIRINRRRVLETLGAFTLASYAGRSLSVGPPVPGANGPGSSGALSCVATPSATEGPYFVDEALHRSDLTSGTTEPAVVNGLPLTLRIGVYRVTSGDCSVLDGAQVDVWHANSAGVYSDVRPQRTVGEKYLRGYQLTDSGGEAIFATIYPGWYPGRAPHIHFKVRKDDFEFTSQWYFDDAVTDGVYSASPYDARSGRRTRNANDWIYKSSLLLALEQDSAKAGYVGTFSIGLKF